MRLMDVTSDLSMRHDPHTKLSDPMTLTICGLCKAHSGGLGCCTWLKYYDSQFSPILLIFSFFLAPQQANLEQYPACEFD